MRKTALVIFIVIVLQVTFYIFSDKEEDAAVVHGPVLSDDQVLDTNAILNGPVPQKTINRYAGEQDFLNCIIITPDEYILQVGTAEKSFNSIEELHVFLADNISLFGGVEMNVISRGNYSYGRLTDVTNLLSTLKIDHGRLLQ